MSDTATLLRRLRNGSAIIALLAFVGVGVAFFLDFGPSLSILMGVVASMLAILVAIHVTAIAMRVASEHRMRAIIGFLEHDTAPGFCTDEDGRIFSQNRAATERFGDRDGATMTRALNTLFANPEAVVHRLQIAVQGQATTREEVVTRKGHVRVAIHRIPGGYLWRLEDIVDKSSRAADGIGLPILTFGASGTILSMNEALRHAVGKRVKRLRDLFEEVPLENGSVNRIKVKDGLQPVRVILSDPVNNRQEAYVLPAGEGHDDRVGLDVLPVALIRLDAEGAVISANKAARDLLPIAGKEAEPRLSAMVEGLGRSVREWIAEAASGRGLYRPEVVRVTDAAEETFLQITLSRPLDGDGGLIAVLNDATELKTMEAQFVQSQKMQAIGQLAGGVAHDFNNLLTAISGHCDLLLLRHDEADEDYADLIQITQNANRAAALVGQLLAFSRKQTLEMQQVDLRETLSDLTHLLNRLVGERTELRLDHDPALIPIRGDRRQLEQVLMNLVVNARDAMPDGGKILVETRCRYLERPMTRDRATVPAGQYVVVSVTDEGCGIPRDSLSRIFEPFFTTKRPGEGTGLGLSMVYGIVKQSGGFIFCDSTVGEGTRFSLFFPADLDESRLSSRDGTDAILAPALHAITTTSADSGLEQAAPLGEPPLRLPEPMEATAAQLPAADQAGPRAADPFADLPDPDPFADLPAPDLAPVHAVDAAAEPPEGDDVVLGTTPEGPAPGAEGEVVGDVAPATESPDGKKSAVERSPIPDVADNAGVDAYLTSISAVSWNIPGAPAMDVDDPSPGPSDKERTGVSPDGPETPRADGPVEDDAVPTTASDAEPSLLPVEPTIDQTADAVRALVDDRENAESPADVSERSLPSENEAACENPEDETGDLTGRQAPDIGDTLEPALPLSPAETLPDRSVQDAAGRPSDLSEEMPATTTTPETPRDIDAEEAVPSLDSAARSIDGLGDGQADQPDVPTDDDQAAHSEQVPPLVEGATSVPGSQSAEPTPVASGISPAETLIRDAERVAEESTRKPIVLLVEDEAPVRAFASRALRLRGCTVLEAANAEDALETLMDSDLKVDLFVTDVMMPGMDGPSWVREALKARPDVRTVFMSGYTQDALSDTSAPVPNAVFLPKPFSLSDLTRTVERALN
ncbi:MAG: ATP-binding protein [Pseudomonadota bacterium]